MAFGLTLLLLLLRIGDVLRLGDGLRLGDDLRHEDEDVLGLDDGLLKDTQGLAVCLRLQRRSSSRRFS
jgi:hypothetical protein